MGELIRSINWTKTPLGPPESWPQVLQLATGIVLATPFPMYIAWGKEYTQIYNDGYRPILGSTKHPQAMGISTRETFSEIWHIIDSMFEGVMNGTAVGFPNFMLPLERNGYVEECLFDFSYSPIPLPDGTVGGVLVTVIEVTEKVKSFNALKSAKENLESAKTEIEIQRSRLNKFFMEAPAAICVVAGPDMVFELVNPRYQQFFPGRTLLGKSVFEALPEIKGQPIEGVLHDVYASGKTFEGFEQLVPLVRRENGPIEDSYFNFIYQARYDSNNVIDGIMVFAFEVTEAVKTRKEFKEVAENFKLLADNMSQLAWIADEKGWIYWYNQRWYEYTGMSLEEMQGWGWEKVNHTDHVERIKTRWSEHLNSGEIFEDTFPLKNKNGEWNWFLTRAVPLKNDDGKIVRWFGTNTDITEQRNIDQQKDDFISVASHELKTPITSLTANLQMLQRMKGDLSSDRVPAFIENANKSVTKVKSLVEDLLNASRLHQGQLHLNKNWFTLSELIQECCGNLQFNGIQVIVKGDENLKVFADKNRIEQVLVNFFNNAIKYAAGSKAIECEIKKEASFAKVSVIDTGQGIAKDQLPHLFDRYYRADQKGNQISGLGLGLYICAEIIKKHDGSIGAESEIGKGTTFWFMLPIE